MSNVICDYGCGQEATYQFKNGKWCCSKNVMQCPINSQKTSKGLKKYFTKNKDAIEKNRENVKNFYKNETLEEKEKRIQKHIKSHSGKKYKKQASIKSKRTISQIKERFPIFTIDEEMRYEPGKKNERIIQVHCKNHLCSNSKEKDGWFTPTSSQIDNRIASLDRYGEGNGYMYCSEECKHECDLFGKRVSQLMITENDCKYPYTRIEYVIWREEVLNRANNLCEYCGEQAEDAHHSRPQKLEPGLALDPDFGIACCKRCHHKYGHTNRECTYGYIANK